MTHTAIDIAALEYMSRSLEMWKMAVAGKEGLPCSAITAAARCKDAMFLHAEALIVIARREAEMAKERDELKFEIEVAEAVLENEQAAHADTLRMFTSLRALLAEAGEAIEPFAAAYDRMMFNQKERVHTHFLGVTADFRRSARVRAAIQSALRESPTTQKETNK